MPELENGLDTQIEDTLTEDVSQVETTEERDGFTLDGAISEIKKLRQEAAANRVKAKEADEAKTEIESRLNEALEKHKTFEAEIKSLSIETQLAGKVIDTKKALKLVDASYFAEDGSFQVDKFLTENEFLQPVKPVNNTPLNKGVGKPTEVNYTVDNWFDHLK